MKFQIEQTNQTKVSFVGSEVLNTQVGGQNTTCSQTEKEINCSYPIGKYRFVCHDADSVRLCLHWF